MSLSVSQTPTQTSMNTIETNLETITSTLTDEILNPRPEETELPRFRKLLIDLQRSPSPQKEATLRKALWMGFGINLLPQSITDQMEYFRGRESYILKIEDGIRTYQIHSSEICI